MLVENFSLWCDFIEKSFLNQGLKDLIHNKGIKGATSNPAIFQKAFHSTAYRQDLEYLKKEGLGVKEIYEELATHDIKTAAKIFQPLFGQNHQQGWVSIEIDPFLSDRTKESVQEGKRLYAKIAEPNVMIKVPATESGYAVMEELAALSIPINATLIFSPDQAEATLQALRRGWEQSAKQADFQAVISIFVSRFDRKCNDSLPDSLKNRLGIMNATHIYHKIQSHQMPFVRALFASTGVKSDDLPASYYVDSLLYPHSINTAPIETIAAFFGGNRVSIPSEEETQNFYTLIAQQGINMEAIYQELLDEGIDSFRDSFRAILEILS